jgi:hypothetical protein
LGLFDGYGDTVPPGIPKTFKINFGYVSQAAYGDEWFYVVFTDGSGSPISQAQVHLPADLVWAP